MGVAKLDSLTADAQLDGNASALFDPTKSETLNANVKAKGLAVENFEQGQAGEPGHKKLDKATIDTVEASYDKADGGKASVKLTDAKLEGFEMKSTKLADTKARMGELIAKLRSGADMKPDEMKELETLDAALEEYGALKKKYADAKTKQWKKYYEDKLAVWEKESVTAVKKANIGTLKVNASNVGDITKGGPDIGKVKLDAELDHADAEGIQAGDMKVGKASVDGLKVSAENLDDAEKRKISGSMKSAELDSVRTGSAMASKIKVKDAKGGMDGRSVDVRAGRVSAYNAYSGGGGVGEAHLGGFGVGIRNFGTEKETTSVVSASLNASAISKAKKGGMTTIDSATGRGFRMQSGKGGPKGVGSSMGFDEVDAKNIQDHSTDEKGNQTTISLGDAGGKGIDIASKYGVTTIKAKEGYASNFAMSGEDKAKGSTMVANAERVDAKGATVKIGTAKTPGGAAPISAEADEVSVKNGGYGAYSGPKAAVMNESGVVSERGDYDVTGAAVGSAKVKDAKFAMADDKMSASFSEGEVKDAHFDQRTYNKDGKEKEGIKAGMGKGTVTGFKMAKEGDDKLDVHADRVKGEDLSFEKSKDGKVIQSLEDIQKQGGAGSEGKTNSVEITDIDLKKRGKEMSIEYAEIRGDNLVFKDESNPDSKVKAVLTYFQAGDKAGPKSKASIGADGKIDADLKTIKIGGGSSFKFGKDPDQLVRFNQEVSAGNITMQDFNPKDPTEAGSHLQILNINGADILYNDTTYRAFVKGAHVDKLYVAGLGDGQMAAGYEGAHVDQVKVFERPDDTANIKTKIAQIDDANSSKGNLLFEKETGADGQESTKLKYAEVADLDVKKLGLDIDLRDKPNQSSVDIAKKEEAKKKEAEDKEKNPEKYRWELGALDNTTGKVKVKIPHGMIRKAVRADDATAGTGGKIWNEVVDFATEGDRNDHTKLEIEVDIVNGKIDGGKLEALLAKGGMAPEAALRVRQHVEDQIVNKKDDGKPSDPLIKEIELDIQAEVAGGHVKAGQYGSGDVKAGTKLDVKTTGNGLGSGITVNGEDVGLSDIKHGEATLDEKDKVRKASRDVEKGPDIKGPAGLDDVTSMDKREADGKVEAEKKAAEEARKKAAEEAARKKKWEEERAKAGGKKSA